MVDYQTRVSKALETIERCGMIDGEHHKQWVLDQILQDLLREGYAKWVEDYNAYVGPEGETYDSWDKGIPP